MSRNRWEALRAARNARERGEDGTGRHEHPGKALLERATANRSPGLRHYLEAGSSAQRTDSELERLLDGMAAARAPRERWLREVLNVCED